jgi:hypothetical protein
MNFALAAGALKQGQVVPNPIAVAGPLRSVSRKNRIRMTAWLRVGWGSAGDVLAFQTDRAPAVRCPDFKSAFVRS